MPSGPATPAAEQKEDTTMMEISNAQKQVSKLAGVQAIPSPAPLPNNPDALLASLNNPSFSMPLSNTTFTSMAPADLDALMASFQPAPQSFQSTSQVSQATSQSSLPPTSMPMSNTADFDQLMASFTQPTDPQQLPDMGNFDVDQFLQSLGAGNSNGSG